MPGSWEMTLLMSSITGKVAFITGGSRGIGLATARALASNGASVAITGTDQGHLDSAVAALGGNVLGIRADVRQYSDVEAALSQTVAKFGGLDILINNAGVGVFRPVADMAVEEWHRIIDTNLSGVFYTCSAALPHLKRRGGGWIINISSLAGTNPFIGGAAYCASKAGLNAFSEALMQEVRYDNIRVSYIMPGSVETGFSHSGSGADWKIAPEDVADIVLELVTFPSRSLPSRIELRPSRPKKK